MHMGWWRCRESNPGPMEWIQDFSERSPLCFSRPRQSRGQAADGPSYCLISLPPPQPGRTVEFPRLCQGPGRERPGLTPYSLADQAARANCGVSRLVLAIIFLRHVVNEIIAAFLGSLLLFRLPPSKPIIPMLI